MKEVCILLKKDNSGLMVFKDQKLAEEYLQEWGFNKFDHDVWAKTEEDIKLGNYYKVMMQEIISNSGEKKK
ncbi:hypothetical protein K9M74_03740 [Candidatus Woesearchaeota archaeon]|nr:hypothetical protein [Candidatus Woesearchaeota archaeon]